MSSEPALSDHVGMLSMDWGPGDPRSRAAPSLQGDIHLWTVDLASSGDTLSACLTAADISRGERIADAGKRRLYLGGRAGARFLLSAYAGIPADRIRFGYGARGKPELTDGVGRLRFNYSLSGNRVLYALAEDRELGVDIEVLPRRTRADCLAARKLTAAERTAWHAIPKGMRNDAMLCCWTRKEAYGKALGVGIRYNLGQVALFDRPGSCWFDTPRAGLFPGTDTRGMSTTLAGVQVKMPFPAVAALVYPDDGRDRPAIRAWQLDTRRISGNGHEPPGIQS